MARLSAPRAGYFTLTLDDIDFRRGGKEFVAELKRDVPSQCRDYDPERKVWTIDEKFYGVVRQKVEDYFIPPNHDLFQQQGVADGEEAAQRQAD